MKRDRVHRTRVPRLSSTRINDQARVNYARLLPRSTNDDSSDDTVNRRATNRPSVFPPKWDEFSTTPSSLDVRLTYGDAVALSFGPNPETFEQATRGDGDCTNTGKDSGKRGGKILRYRHRSERARSFLLTATTRYLPPGKCSILYS